MKNDFDSKKNLIIDFNQLPKETQQLIIQCRKKWEISTSYHNQYFGNAPSIKSCIFNGKRLVALGGSLVQSDDEQREWRTPSDFLLSHLTTCLGKEWFDIEIQSSEDQHEIIKWSLNGNFNTNNAKNLELEAPNGSALALLHLAYDLYVLANQNNLPKRLIDNLKVKKNFNGARYEAFVFATLVRAGFNVEYLDEVSGKNGKVVDCRAKHIVSGEYISVEAKTRNVQNVLGAIEGNKNKIKLYRNLREAIEKNANEPYVLFVDLNLPNFSVQNAARREAISSAHRKLEKSHGDKLPNLICYTNIPFHYGKHDVSPENSAYGFVIFQNPKHKLKNSEKIIQSIKDSVDKYAFLPKEFNESDNFAKTIAHP